MAKTSALTTLQPERFSSQAEIYHGEAKAVVEMMNYAAQYFPQTHVNLCTAINEWDGAASTAGSYIFAPSAEGTRTVLRFGIVLLEEAQDLIVGARVICGTGEEVDMHVTVTPDWGDGTPITTTISYDDTTNGAEQWVALDVSGVPYDELECLVTIELETVVSVGGQDSYMRTFRIEDSPLLSLPDPGAP